jgi:hypothetical protein
MRCAAQRPEHFALASHDGGARQNPRGDCAAPSAGTSTLQSWATPERGPGRAQGLELAVPGTYIAGEPVVTIAAFAPQLHVITSKQRPRKLTIHGSDGAEYMFLLKARPA